MVRTILALVRSKDLTVANPVVYTEPHLDILRLGAKKKIGAPLRGLPTEIIEDKSSWTF
jgi:hypothetical protein